MLIFFVSPYPDEIAYSIFSRYDVLNGNLGFSQTSKELFGIKEKSFNIFYPSHLDNFIKLLPSDLDITSETIIGRNSIFPLFKPFMTIERANRVIKNMCNGNPKWLHDEIGIYSGNIFNKSGQAIKTCPLCFKEDVEKYGEAYIHRLFQIPGNFICEKHQVYLNEYIIPTNRNSLFDINSIDTENLSVAAIEENFKINYLDLSQDIVSVLNGSYENYDLRKIKNIYRNKLQEKGYIHNIRIKQKQLISDFKSYYPTEFLLKLESDVDENDENCWITNIATDKSEFTHPIRHLLFIRFLFGSAELLEDTENKFKPFGEGPWPCLNPVADHYKKLAISNCDIKTHGNSRVVGTFKCKCGFVYSRQGPDKTEDDKYNCGMVLQRGEVWNNKLLSLILESNLSLTKIANEMKCGRVVIIRCATDLGINDKLNTKMKIKENHLDKVDFDLYKNEIIKFINNNTNANRTEIKNNLRIQYMALYNKDNNWLESVLPEPLHLTL